MINYDLLNLLEKVLGKGRKTSGNNYSFFSPFISHYKPKLEIDLTANNNGQNFWHCWVSNAKGRDIISLFKQIKVEKIEYKTGQVICIWDTIAKASVAENISATKMSISIKNKIIYNDDYYYKLFSSS